MTVSSNLSQDNNELVISVSGKFDFTQVKSFRDAYTSTADSGNNTSDDMEYVVDLQETEHMDSSALGMLLNMRKHLGDSVKISITNTRPQIKKILTISRFDKKFSVQ